MSANAHSEAPPRVRLEVDGAIASLVWQRPEKRNALTPSMLADAIRLLAALPPDARVLLLEGEGDVFCAGFDLSLCVAAPDGRVMRELLIELSQMVTALRNLPIPVVAAVQGGAIAGGCALLGGADVVISDSAAKLGYPVTRLGISPGVSAPFMVPGIGAGPARARQLDPGLIDARRGLEIGLVHRLVAAPGDVRPEARKIAAELSAKPPHALAATKRWLMELDAVTPSVIATGLDTSLRLTGGDEERRLLGASFGGNAPAPEDGKKG